MPSRLGSEMRMLSGAWRCFVQPQHALARRRRIVVRDDRLPAHLLHRDLPAVRQRMLRRDEQHQLVGPELQRQQVALRRVERQHAEVDRAQQDLLRHLARVHAPDVHQDGRIVLLERGDERQQTGDAGLVCANQHAALAHVAKLGDGVRGLVGQPKEARGVVEQELAGVGQRAVAGRPVDEPLAARVLEPADGLAHGGLGPPQLAGGAREAALGRDGDEDAEILECHGLWGPGNAGDVGRRRQWGR